MNLFRSEEHVERWLAGREPGVTIPVSQLALLAHAWWSDRLDARWRPHARDENQAILERVVEERDALARVDADRVAERVLAGGSAVELEQGDAVARRELGGAKRLREPPLRLQADLHQEDPDRRDLGDPDRDGLVVES